MINPQPGHLAFYRTATTLYPAVVTCNAADVLVLRVDWGDRCTDLSIEWAPGHEEYHRIAPPF